MGGSSDVGGGLTEGNANWGVLELGRGAKGQKDLGGALISTSGRGFGGGGSPSGLWLDNRGCFSPHPQASPGGGSPFTDPPPPTATHLRAASPQLPPLPSGLHLSQSPIGPQRNGSGATIGSRARQSGSPAAPNAARAVSQGYGPALSDGPTSSLCLGDSFLWETGSEAERRDWLPLLCRRSQSPAFSERLLVILAIDRRVPRGGGFPYDVMREAEGKLGGVEALLYRPLAVSERVARNVA